MKKQPSAPTRPAPGSHHLTHILPLDRMLPASHPALLVPEDCLLLPAQLDGSLGQFRRPAEENGAGADNDLDALRVWLSRCKSVATHRAYRKEAERFLGWALVERGQPLSSLTTADCQAYAEFLRTVGTPSMVADPALWVGPITPRASDAWRPFQGALSVRTVSQALVIAASLMQWLKEVGYIRHNPFSQMAIRQTERSKIQAIEHFLSEEQVDFLLDFAANLDDYVADERHHEWIYSSIAWEGETEVYRFARRSAVWINMQERLLCFLTLYFQTGARISELAAARMEDLYLLQAQDGAQWWLRLLGKGSKSREVPLPNAMAAVVRYRQYRGLSPYPAPRETAPLIASAGGEKPVAAHALHNELKRFIWLVCRHLSLKGTAEQQSSWVPRLRHMTMHWTRHSFASQLVKTNTPLPLVAELLGHSSVAVTRIYSHFEKHELFRHVKASTKKP